MNKVQFKRIREGKGFIAALDQSGGSTPKALQEYGIPEGAYANEEEMFEKVHEMRTRIMTSPAFSPKYILGSILFENTMRRDVDGKPTADYLWTKKTIVPFLKVDKGLADLENGVQIMRPVNGLPNLLREAVEKNIFGTKMRSVIKTANARGIADVVAQQFDVAARIVDAGLVPIIEPEVDIHSPDRRESEKLLKEEIFKRLSALGEETKVMFKFTIPVEDNFYQDLMKEPPVLRVVALSGGYSRTEANVKLARNNGLIASFSRALTEGLSARQSGEQFNATLTEAVKSIYEASVT